MNDESPPGSPVDEVVEEGAPLADAAHDSAALRRSRRRAAALSVVLLAVGLVGTVSLLIDPVQPWFQPFDDAALRWARTHRWPFAIHVAEVLDVAGSVVVTVPLRILAVIVLLVRRRWLQLATFVVAIVLSELCIGPLKWLVDRARPPGSLVATSAPSFPSGHSIAAAVTAFGLVIAFLPRGRRRVHWSIVASLVAASMAWSRVYLGAHWATDTIAGVCIGTGLAVGVEVLFEGGRTAAADHAEATSGGRSGAGADLS